MSTAASPSPIPTVSNVLIQSNSKLLKRHYSKSHKSKRQHDKYLDSDSDSDSDDEYERNSRVSEQYRRPLLRYILYEIIILLIE